jgi:hypothetical protein
VKQLMFARHSCHQGHLPPISLHLAPLSVAAQTGAEKSPLPGSRRGGDETPFDGMSSTMPLNKPIKYRHCIGGILQASHRRGGPVVRSRLTPQSSFRNPALVEPVCAAGSAGRYVEDGRRNLGENRVHGPRLLFIVLRWPVNTREAAPPMRERNGFENPPLVHAKQGNFDTL